MTTIDGDDYAELITDLLTEAKREVEDAWDWTSLKGTVLLDTIVGTYRYKVSAVYQGSVIKAVDRKSTRLTPVTRSSRMPSSA